MQILISLRSRSDLVLDADKGNPEKARVFLFAEPLKSLEKEKRTKTARKIGKQKARKSKKKSKDWRVRACYAKEVPEVLGDESLILGE